MYVKLWRFAVDEERLLCYTKLPFLLTEKRVFCQMPERLVTAGIRVPDKIFPICI